MISAGRLRFRAQIRRSNATGALGLRNKDYEDVIGYFRCDMTDLGGGESSYAGGISDIRNWELSCRWQAIYELGLLASDHIVVDGKTLNISAISNEYNRDRLGKIQCSEVT